MNKIVLAGKVITEPVVTHESKGEKFYGFQLEVLRDSGTADIVPCCMSEVFLGTIYEELLVKIVGDVRTFNRKKENSEKTKLEVYVFVNEVLEHQGVDENYMELQGAICKPPICRHTPKGRQITDLLVASNRRFGKSDYLPCIAWGREAYKASLLQVGSEIEAYGRFQSREYLKKYLDHEEILTTYEISISSLDVREEEQ